MGESGELISKTTITAGVMNGAPPRATWLGGEHFPLARSGGLRSQSRVQTNASRLSSGLRINSAADDPSGLAIAEGLQSKVNGYDEAVSNVQDANNALTVADGAMQTTTDILQRLRTLAVKAASDVLSQSDKANLQTEISQLLHEVDTISQNTNFNGVPLLDGSRSGPTPPQAATIDITTNALLASGTVSVAPVNLLTNPSFADPALGVGYTSFAGSTVGGWYYNGAGQGLYQGVANIAGKPTAAPAGGGQAAFLEDTLLGNSGSGSSINQFVDLTAGHTYTVSADMASSGSPTALVGLVIQYANLSSTVLTSNGSAPGWAPLTNMSFANNTYQFTASASGSALFYVESSNSSPTDTAYDYVSNLSIIDNSPVPPLSGLLVASAVAANANFNTTAGGVSGLGGTGTSDGTIEIQVVNTGASIAAQETFIDSATGAISVSPTLLSPNSSSTLFDNVAINTGNFSSADVGVTGYVKVGQNVPQVVNGNPALGVHSGANEGNVLQVELPAVNAAMLRISNIKTDPELAAEDAIGQIDHALSTLLTQRAQVGAFMVRLGNEASNGSVASMNLQSSESNIRDLNVAQATTAYAAEQILSGVGTSILGNIKTLAASVEKLFQ